MRRREFIDMILNSISDTFDIYHNYWFEGRKFVIYAYSYNKKDRFSTTDDAKLWDSKCYEHLFFINCDTLGMKELDDLYDFAVNKIDRILYEVTESCLLRIICIHTYHL